MILEACVETLEQSVKAESQGANRLELCGRLDLGGITPDYELVENVRAQVKIPIMVMVRPRGGNFIFNDIEMKEMLETISKLKTMEIQGIVIGNLKEDHSIHVEQTTQLAKAAAPLSVTFHKAIDVSNDLFESVKKLKSIDGIDRILTSGGEATALEGSENIKRMIQIASDNLIILSAGKITSKNIEQVHLQINANEYHGRKIVGDL